MGGSIKLPFAQAWYGALWIALACGLAVVWARSAELTTTLEVPGQLAAEAVNARVQATEFGRVTEIYVGNFDHVRSGDILAKLDDGALSTEIAKLAEQKHAFESEYRLINAELRGAGPDDGANIKHTVHQAFDAARSFHDSRISALKAQISASEARAEFLEKQLSLIDARIELAAERAQTLGALRGSGHATEFALLDANSERLELSQDFARLEDERQLNIAQAQAAQQDIASERNARRSDLAERREVLLQELNTLDQREAQLEARAETVLIRAPRDGELSGWSLSPFETVSPGDVVGQVTGPIGPVHVSLQIPPDQVDQVFVGQQGLVTFSTLPQRDIPRVEVTLKSKAIKSQIIDGSDQPSFSAVAEFNANDFEALLNVVKEGYYLALDVPVTVVLEGRDMTVWSYVFDPLTSAFRRAAQD